MQYEELTEKIIGCAYKVYNKMGFGFLESVYEKCMLIELKKNKLNSESQKSIKVYYDNTIVGDYRADILVENKIIVELKSIRQILQEHEVQIVNYLTATKLDIGLLINFSPKKVQVKRKVRELIKNNY